MGEVRNRQGWRKHRMRMRTRQRRRMRISPQRSQAVLCLLQAITLVLAHAGQSKVDDVSVGLEDVNTETRPSAAPARKLCSSTRGSSGSRVLVREGSGEVLADEIGILAVCVWLPPQDVAPQMVPLLPQIHHSDPDECFI